MAAKKKTSTSKMALSDKLRSKLSNVQKGGGSKVNWISFKDEGKHTFRLVAPTNGPHGIFLKHQRGTRRGKFGTALDLDWLYDEQNADDLQAMKERLAVTDVDDKLYNEYGEPYTILFNALQASNKAKLFSDARIGQKRCMFVALMDGEFGVLEMNMGFGETIVNLLDEIPDLFDLQNGHNLTIQVGPKGNTDRFKSPIPQLKPSAAKLANPESIETPNLWDVLSGRCLGYKEKVKFLFNSHGNLVLEAELMPEDFGVSEEDILSGDNQNG